MLLQFSNFNFENINDKEILKQLNTEAFDVLSCEDSLTTFSSLKYYLFEFLINNLMQEIIQQTNRLNE